MTTLTPFEQLLDADTAMVVNDPFGPGLSVTLVDPDGNEHSLRALFEAPGNDVQPGSQAPVVSTAPMLHFQVSLIQSAIGRPLSTRDTFIVRGRLYRIQRPHTDGFGFVSCKLLEKGEP